MLLSMLRVQRNRIAVLAPVILTLVSGIGGCSALQRRQDAGPIAPQAGFCRVAVEAIERARACEAKQEVFERHREACWEERGARANSALEWSFKEALLNVADCFRESGRKALAEEAYSWGLKRPDWVWDSNEGFMAHAVLKAKAESLARPEPRCESLGSFRRAVQDFTASRDLDLLEPWVDRDFSVGFYPGSSAPSAYSANRAVILRWLPDSRLKLVFEESPCFLVGGWAGAPYGTYAICGRAHPRPGRESCFTWGGFHAAGGGV
ncbi:MAG: hypothetical protein IT285_08065 [Bdellovibrionales bacterium]|nr:hypothetical protein [Bdellovibrionales bacterium]